MPNNATPAAGSVRSGILPRSGFVSLSGSHDKGVRGRVVVHTEARVDIALRQSDVAFCSAALPFATQPFEHGINFFIHCSIKLSTG